MSQPEDDSSRTPSLSVDPLEVKAGSNEIPDKPGFGMEIDENVAEGYEVREPESH